MISSRSAGKNTIFIYDNISGAYRAATNDDLIGGIGKTNNNELILAQKNTILDISSTYGVSVLRDETGIFFGATIQENSGLLELQTNNQTGSNCYIQSIVRGINQFGSIGESSINLRVDNLPTGQQNAKWGYFDGQNGAGYGIDQSGLYVFKLINSNYIKTHRSDWNGNQLSGVTSAYSLNETLSCHNYVCDISCNSLENYILIKNNNTNRHDKVLTNSWNDNNILIDKNQPLRVEINNSTDVGQFKVSVGARSYSIIGGNLDIQKRPLVDSITNYTISAAENVWSPVMAVRRKSTFGPSNRANSVNSRFHGFTAATDQSAEFMITLNGNITGINWQNPQFRSSSETICEVQKITNNDLGITKTGELVSRETLLASNKHDASAGSQENAYFGNGGELILFARRTSNNATTISATLHWDEEY